MKALLFVHYAMALACTIGFTVMACKAPPGAVAWIPSLGLVASLAWLIVTMVRMEHESSRGRF